MHPPGVPEFPLPAPGLSSVNPGWTHPDPGPTLHLRLCEVLEAHKDKITFDSEQMEEFRQLVEKITGTRAISPTRTREQVAISRPLTPLTPDSPRKTLTPLTPDSHKKTLTPLTPKKALTPLTPDSHIHKKTLTPLTPDSHKKKTLTPLTPDSHKKTLTPLTPDSPHKRKVSFTPDQLKECKQLVEKILGARMLPPTPRKMCPYYPSSPLQLQTTRIIRAGPAQNVQKRPHVSFIMCTML